MSPVIVPVVRRAIVDLLADIGGEHTHEEITALLTELGHRVARRDVAEQMAWLAEKGLIVSDLVGRFQVGRVLSDGRDVAAGTYIVEGVSPFKTGE